MTKNIVKRRTRKSTLKGSGLWDDIVGAVKGVVSELRKGKYISKGAKAYGSIPFLPYSNIAGMAGNVAEQAGFGRKKRVRKTTKKTTKTTKKSCCGGGLQLARGRKPRAGKG